MKIEPRILKNGEAMLERANEKYRYRPKRLGGDTVIKGLSARTTVGDFWSWAYSDVMVNTTRSVFAEYLVGLALGTLSDPRIEWGPVDFIYRGKSIEVKSSAFLQSWPQARYSDVRFDVKIRKCAWDPESGKMLETVSRLAHCYVFCLFTDKNEVEGGVLDADMWRFYVLRTEDLDHELGGRRSVGLTQLNRLTDSVSFRELRESIDHALFHEERQLVENRLEARSLANLQSRSRCI